MSTTTDDSTRIRTQIRVYLLVEDLQRQFAAYLGTPTRARGYPPYAQPPLVYLYQVGLGTGQDFGRGGAGGVILTIVILIFTLVQQRLLGLGQRREKGA